MEPFYPYIVIGIVAAIWSYFDTQAENRRTRQMLLDNDRMWNDLIHTNHKAIADAYQEGKRYMFDIKRN